MIRALLAINVAFFTASPLLATMPADYEKWLACEKQQFVWQSKVLPTEYERSPGLNFGGWDELLNFLKAPASLVSLRKTFDIVSDEMPAGRRKFIHPFGSVAKVVFKGVANHPYTGLLSDLEVCGLASFRPEWAETILSAAKDLPRSTSYPCV